MIRTLVLSVCLAAPLARAQAVNAPPPARPIPPPPAPATPAAPPPTTTRPSPEQLHAQAYALMREGKFDKATPLLNLAYNQAPADQRSRPLVLNRAILDLVQKRNVLRGVKELNEYLARDTRADEQATNILGASLELAANNPRWRDGPIYAAALREYARREAVLERGRPGLRRWGAQWITEQEYQAIREKQKELAERTEATYDELVRRTNDLKAAALQYDTARKQFGGFRYHRHVSGNGRATYLAGCPQCRAFAESQESVTAASVEVDVASRRMNETQREYDALQKQQIKPTWPTRFDPVDPSATEPPPWPPPGPATTTAATTTAPASTSPSLRPQAGAATRPAEIAR